MNPAKFRPKFYWQLFLLQECSRQLIRLNLNCIVRVAFWLLHSYYISFIITFCFSIGDIFKEMFVIFYSNCWNWLEAKKCVYRAYILSTAWFLFQCAGCNLQTLWLIPSMTNSGSLGAQDLPSIWCIEACILGKQMLEFQFFLLVLTDCKWHPIVPEKQFFYNVLVLYCVLDSSSNAMSMLRDVNMELENETRVIILVEVCFICFHWQSP